MSSAGYLYRALAIAVLVVTSHPTVAAGKRVALIIGNSEYEHTSSLPNPANDAQLIATVLKEHGFEIFQHINADLKKMKRAIADVASRARAYGKESVVLFYFAGHGVQVRQTNFLVPIDAKIESEGDVDIEALNAASLLETLHDGGASVNIVILDACRNNPYRTSFRSASRGLARIDGPAGFLIAFSTDPGKVATDGPSGGNSPYTLSLAKSFAQPGIKIEEAFKNARKEVYEITRGAQVPWETSSLLAELHIAGAGSNASAATNIPSATPKLDPQLAKQLAAARAEAEAEKAQAEAEIAKADVARRKARTDMERAKAEAEQAAAEAAKARAEADLARTRAQADVARAVADAEQARASASASRSLPQSNVLSTVSLFNPAAVPSFNCAEYAANPIEGPTRNPQTDVLCIAAEAARADYRLGQVFRDRVRGMSTATRKDAIAIQKQWILLRNGRCPATWDDIGIVARRDLVAQCLIRETNVRISELQR